MTRIDPSERARRALAAVADSRTRVELRDADPLAPNDRWRKSAMGFIATVAAASSFSLQAGESHAAGNYVRSAPPPVIVMMDGKAIETISPLERVRLCKEIASQAALKSHGLDWRDLYAVVHAETGWVPRDGMGRNGKVSRGLAQLEDATARSLGVDPHDPRQALSAVASLLKEAASWSRAKGYAVGSGSLSAYYNLSTKARNAWSGESIKELPIETQRHFANFNDGRQYAAHLEKKWIADQKHFEKIVKLNSVYTPRYTEGAAAMVAKLDDSSRSSSTADGEGLRMKGFVGGSIINVLETIHEKVMDKTAQNEMDRKGIRMNLGGLERLKGRLIDVVQEIKVKIDSLIRPEKERQDTPSPAAPTAPGWLSPHRYQSAGLDVPGTSAASPGPGLSRLMGSDNAKVFMRMASIGPNSVFANDNQVRKEVDYVSHLPPGHKRDAAILALGEQADATTNELRQLSRRSLEYSQYFERLASAQENVARQRG